MIRVLIQYPIAAGDRFDRDYYRNQHVPMVQRIMLPLGMLKGEFDEPVAHPAAGGAAKHHVISVQYWESLEAMEKAYASPNTQALKDDIAKFYSGTPVRIISRMNSW